MYATARQEVRVAEAAFGVPVFCGALFGGEVSGDGAGVRVADAALDDEVSGDAAVVGGAAGAWCAEILISAGTLSERGGDPLPPAPMLITPAKPTTSSVRTLSAPTEATPAASRCRRRRR